MWEVYAEESLKEAWPSIRQPYTGVTRDRVNSESTLGVHILAGESHLQSSCAVLLVRT